VLDISQNSIHLDAVDKILPFVGGVRKINVSHNRISKEGCVLLGQLFQKGDTKIEHLEIESNDLSDPAAFEMLRKLSGYAKLKVLNLSCNFLSKDSGGVIAKYLLEPQVVLTELYLHWNELNEDASQPIFESLCLNICLRVLDYSWNYQRDPPKMLPSLRKCTQCAQSSPLN